MRGGVYIFAVPKCLRRS